MLKRGRLQFGSQIIVPWKTARVELDPGKEHLEREAHRPSSKLQLR